MNAARSLCGLAVLAVALSMPSPARAIPPGYYYCMKFCSGSYFHCMLNCYHLWCTDLSTPPAWRVGCPHLWWTPASDVGISFHAFSTGSGLNPLTDVVIDGTVVPYVDTAGSSSLQLSFEDTQAAIDPIREIAVSLLTTVGGSREWIEVARTGAEPGRSGLVIEADLDGDGVPDPLSGILSFEVFRASGAEPTYTMFFLGDPSIEPEPLFHRGDANGDGRVDIADAIFGLGYLFLGGPKPACMDAADSNDTGRFDLSDPIFVLSWAFSGGPAPPAPGPGACGADPTEDSLDCSSYASCR